MVQLWLLVLTVLLLRASLYETYSVPTPAMEGALQRGDYIYMTKTAYGARFSGFRGPGTGVIMRNDVVVFNFPEGDTVVRAHEDQSYYQLARDYGRKNILNPNFRIWTIHEGRPRQMPLGALDVRGVFRRTPYVKRCVAVAGDTLEVRHGEVWVDGRNTDITGNLFCYTVEVSGPFNARALKDQFDISPDDIQQVGPNTLGIALTAEVAEKLKSSRNVVSMARQDHPRGYVSEYHKLPFFPNDSTFHWSEDNYGPIWIPKAGVTVPLTLKNLPLFARVIRAYEGHDLQVKDGEILIDGAKAHSYTFAQDYYWMMGDNRHRSLDSRFWGYVPFDHVVGKAVFVWFSEDPYTGIRRKRLFTRVR